MTKHPRTLRSGVFVVILMCVSPLALMISPGKLTGSLRLRNNAAPHCVPVGGVINLGAIGESTTLGIADGGLKGAVAAAILNVAPGSGGTTTFTVQHRFVTEEGDAILCDPATATTKGWCQARGCTRGI